MLLTESARAEVNSSAFFEVDFQNLLWKLIFAFSFSCIPNLSHKKHFHEGSGFHSFFCQDSYSLRILPYSDFLSVSVK